MAGAQRLMGLLASTLVLPAAPALAGHAGNAGPCQEVLPNTFFCPTPLGYAVVIGSYPQVLTVPNVPPALPRFYGTVPGGMAAYRNPAAPFIQETEARLRALRQQVQAEALPAGTREVTATGTAPVGPGGVDAARRAAVQDALRSALEHVIGVYVSGATVAEKLMILSDRVYTRTEGFAVPGRILQEQAGPDAVTVQVQVTVSLRPLLERLKALGLTRPWRVAIALYEGTGSTVPGAADIAERQLEQRLMDAGFQMVALPLGRNSTPQALLEALREQKEPAADILVLGAAAARVGTRLPITFNNRVLSLVPVYQARIQLRAVNVSTGEVMGMHVADDYAVSKSEDVAAGASVQFALHRAIGSLMENILELPGATTRRVILEVAGFGSRTRAQAFQDAVALLQGVRRVHRGSYDGGRITLEVEVDSYSADRLPADLESAAPMKAFGVTVDADSQSRIRAHASSGEES